MKAKRITNKRGITFPKRISYNASRNTPSLEEYEEKEK
jgi:hypothetical protein